MENSRKLKLCTELFLVLPPCLKPQSPKFPYDPCYVGDNIIICTIQHIWMFSECMVLLGQKLLQRYT